MINIRNVLGILIIISALIFVAVSFDQNIKNFLGNHYFITIDKHPYSTLVDPAKRNVVCNTDKKAWSNKVYDSYGYVGSVPNIPSTSIINGNIKISGSYGSGFFETKNYNKRSNNFFVLIEEPSFIHSDTCKITYGFFDKNTPIGHVNLSNDTVVGHSCNDNTIPPQRILCVEIIQKGN